jgi:hypothetical protein
MEPAERKPDGPRSEAAVPEQPDSKGVDPQEIEHQSGQQPTAYQPIVEPVSSEELNAWRRGFTPQAEIWNGRLAMLGLAVGLSVLLIARLSHL